MPYDTARPSWSGRADGSAMPDPTPANANFVFTHRPDVGTPRPIKQVFTDSAAEETRQRNEAKVAARIWESLVPQDIFSTVSPVRAYQGPRMAASLMPNLSGMPVAPPLTDSVGRSFSWAKGDWRQTSQAAPSPQPPPLPADEPVHRRIEL
jgi:hypothetical protein